jgi:alkaline phosphatase
MQSAAACPVTLRGSTLPISLAPIVCAASFKLLMCPPPPPPPPPIEALSANPSAAEALAWQQQPVANGTRPRNLILFIGDGMGLTTVSAARVLAEQRGKTAAEAVAAIDAARSQLAIEAASSSVAKADTVAADAARSDLAPPKKLSRTERKAAEKAERIANAQKTRDNASTAAAKPFGDSGELGFELFPATAIGRTNLYRLEDGYAGALSAILTGVVTRPTSIGLDGSIDRGACPALSPVAPLPAVDPADKKAVAAAEFQARVDSNIAATRPTPRLGEVTTLLEAAKDAGLAVGIVTTGRVTLAAPAAGYAHVSDPDWETDRRMPSTALDDGCRDIARQLVEFNRLPRPDAEFIRLADEFKRRAAKQRKLDVDFSRIATGYGGLDVVFGGGRIAFMPPDRLDPVDLSRRGVRLPRGSGGVDLTWQWQLREPSGVYVTSGKTLRQNLGTVGPMLGLFAPDHMSFDAERVQHGVDEPSLAEMTEAAITRLTVARAGLPKGYVLIVNAAGIDRALHLDDTQNALTEILALSKAVSTAVTMTRADNDTLIVVTAGHGHVVIPNRDAATADPARASMSPQMETASSGEDVPIYARGPGAQWIHGAITPETLHGVLVAAILPSPAKPENKPVEAP